MAKNICKLYISQGVNIPNIKNSYKTIAKYKMNKII